MLNSRIPNLGQGFLFRLCYPIAFIENVQKEKVIFLDFLLQGIFSGQNVNFSYSAFYILDCDIKLKLAPNYILMRFHSGLEALDTDVLIPIQSSRKYIFLKDRVNLIIAIINK